MTPKNEFLWRRLRFDAGQIPRLPRADRQPAARVLLSRLKNFLDRVVHGE